MDKIEFYNKYSINFIEIQFPDIYFTPEYGLACEYSDNAEWECCIYKDLIYVYLKKPILYNNNYYVDGAVLNPFPYKYNTCVTKKYGLWLFEKYEIDFIKNNNVEFINELGDSFKYIMDLLRIIHVNYIKNFYKKIPKDVIYIDFEFKGIEMNNFELTLEDRKKMFDIGVNKSKLFFNKKYKRIRRRYLLRKYFTLLAQGT